MGDMMVVVLKNLGMNMINGKELDMKLVCDALDKVYDPSSVFKELGVIEKGPFKRRY